MRANLFLLSFLLLLTACGPQGNNVPADAPVDFEMEMDELEDFDPNERPEDAGKIATVVGKVVSAQRSAPNEKQFGSHFIHLIGQVNPDKAKYYDYYKSGYYTKAYPYYYENETA